MGGEESHATREARRVGSQSWARPNPHRRPRASRGSSAAAFSSCATHARIAVSTACSETDTESPRMISATVSASVMISSALVRPPFVPFAFAYGFLIDFCTHSSLFSFIFRMRPSKSQIYEFSTCVLFEICEFFRAIY